MFLSKIWLFLLALAAAAALTIAFVLPRPAQRTTIDEQRNRLQIACSVVDILLADNASKRVELAASFSRAPEIVAALDAASGVDKVDPTSPADIAKMKSVRELGDTLMRKMEGPNKPDFAMMIDRRGRVVARVHVEDTDFGDTVAGRPLVDDALAGYLRDDLWVVNGTLYLVSASPVIKRDPPPAYVGAVVLGHAVTHDIANALVTSLAVDVGFYLGSDDVASSRPLGFDRETMAAGVKAAKGADISKDCQQNATFDVHAGSDDFTALTARLPGEATARGAYYAVFLKKPAALGFMGTLKEVRSGDLSFASFPWILLGGGFLIALAIGIGLMFMEADLPLRRLTADAVKLGQGETDRLSEEAHGGKFGSIARSVNIRVDKLGREAKTAKKDLDQLLGPAPDGSLGTIDLLATALPSVRPGGAAPLAPPPPSEFRFGEPAAPAPAPPPAPVFVSAPPPSAPVFAVTAPPPRPPAPPVSFAPPAPPAPPPRTNTPPPRPATAPSALRLDDDILGGAPEAKPAVLSTPSSPPAPVVDDGAADPYFKSVFDQFVTTKKSCGESIAGLTFAKFAEKLVKNRDDLMAKTGCREVRFTVYIKDGKAALKATPVKDE